MLLVHCFNRFAQIVNRANSFAYFLVLLEIVLCDLILYLIVIDWIYVLWIKNSLIKIRHNIPHL